MLGVKVGASQAEPFWTEFLRSLNLRGLRGVKLVISDSHEGIKAAASMVLKATYMPVMDGLAAAKAIRATSIEPRPVLIALSAIADDELLRIREAGFNNYICKRAPM